MNDDDAYVLDEQMDALRDQKAEMFAALRDRDVDQMSRAVDATIAIANKMRVVIDDIGERDKRRREGNAR